VLDHLMAELRAEAGRAAKAAAVDHHAAAHAGAERVHQEVTRGTALDVLGLGQCRAVGIVVHEDGHAKATRQLPAQLDAGKRDVHARQHPSRGEVDLRGNAHPDRRRRSAGLVDHLAHGRLDPRDHGLARLDRRRPQDLQTRLGARDHGGRDLGPAHIHADHVWVARGGHARHSVLPRAQAPDRDASPGMA
jgi:hypothetical protein